MKITPDFCVIGGGVAGLTCARSLSASGASVAIVERSAIGLGASHAAAGMLAPLIEARLEEHEVVRFGFECLRYYPEFVARLEEESGQHVDYRSDGTMFVGIDRDDIQQLHHLYEEQRSLGLPVEWLSGYECRQLEPHLATGVPGGIFSPQDHQVDNRRLVNALIASLSHRENVTISDNVQDGLFIESGDRFVYSTPSCTVSAGHYVIATGAHTELLSGALSHLAKKVRPVKGQIMRLDQTAQPMLNHVVRTPEMYLAPKSNGHVVLGASSEDRGFDNSITVGQIFELLRAAWECMPGVYELPIVETRVGFRPAAIDHKPLIGDSGVEDIALAMGYYRHGILFAPYAAELLASSLLHDVENEWLNQFSAMRFNAVNA